MFKLMLIVLFPFLEACTRNGTSPQAERPSHLTRFGTTLPAAQQTVQADAEDPALCPFDLLKESRPLHRLVQMYVFKIEKMHRQNGRYPLRLSEQVSNDGRRYRVAYLTRADGYVVRVYPASHRGAGSATSFFRCTKAWVGDRASLAALGLTTPRFGEQAIYFMPKLGYYVAL